MVIEFIVVDDSEGLEFGPYGTSAEAYRALGEDAEIVLSCYAPEVVRRIDSDFRTDVEVDENGEEIS